MLRRRILTTGNTSNKTNEERDNLSLFVDSPSPDQHKNKEKNASTAEIGIDEEVINLDQFCQICIT